MQFIDLRRQYQLLKSEIDRAVLRVFERAEFILGPEVAQLEALLAEFVQVDHCITLGSGTEALQVALMALGIGVGDEVITTPFTWISSAEAIRLVGATPVFVDIDSSTYNMDPSLLEEAITSRTKAIIPVSLYGQMADLQTINAIAKRRGIFVIEDGAQSFGATQGNKWSCGATLLGATSFFPSKPFGCYGDGGALFTSDAALAKRVREIRVHGQEARHHHTLLGMNARFDTVQAAVLLAKWPHFQEELQARFRIAERYTQELKDCCTTPTVACGNSHVYAQYTIRVSQRKDVMDHLAQEGIPSMIHYPKCLHQQPVFLDLGYCAGSFPCAEAAAQEVLSLPMHPWLAQEEQDKIISATRKALMAEVKR